MSEELDVDEIRKSVDEVKNPESFSIIEAITERSYPQTTVSVSLDEGVAYEAAILKEELDELTRSTASSKPSLASQKKIDELTEKLEELTAKMFESSYTFYIKGISEGKREELATESRKKYPVEYEKPSDIGALIGATSDLKEKPSPERDNLFTDLLWREHIIKIETKDGRVQDTVGYSDVKALRHNLPLSSLAKINSAIEKVRTATAVFMMETGEDFLAKP